MQVACCKSTLAHLAGLTVDTSIDRGSLAGHRGCDLSKRRKVIQRGISQLACPCCPPIITHQARTTSCTSGLRAARTDEAGPSLCNLLRSIDRSFLPRSQIVISETKFPSTRVHARPPVRVRNSACYATHARSFHRQKQLWKPRMHRSVSGCTCFMWRRSWYKPRFRPVQYIDVL